MNDERALSHDPLKESPGQTETSNLFLKGSTPFFLFMILYPFINLFLSTLFIRTIIALSSHHWLMVWMALELNIISFIPIISSSGWFQESESALKYLLFQAIGSSLILFGITGPALSSLTLIGLSIKLGVAPFHYWFPSVVKGIPWPSTTLLITWQKLAPIILITTSFNQQALLLTFLGLTSALVGGLGGIIQTQLRPLLAYSSIGHMGWMLTAAVYSPLTRFFYLLVYIFISLPIIWVSFNQNLQGIKERGKPMIAPHTVALITLLISLGGLPPFLGFLPKLTVLLSINNILAPLILILGSLINLSFYLNIIFSLSLSFPHRQSPSPIKRNFSSLIIFTLFLATSPLPLLFFLFLII